MDLSQLIDIFLHLDRHLADVVANYGVWVYALLFLIIFVETGLVVMPFLPGDSLLFVAGTLAGVGAMDLPLLMGLLTVAAILGDAVMAIDEGLWYLHKNMARGTSGTVPIGFWNGANVDNGYYSNDAANVNAFEVNGFLKTGPADDPYTETVSRGLDMLFTRLTATTIPTSVTNGDGTFNPDSNGNGLGVYITQGLYAYQGGPFVDAIVASGTPNAIAPLGGANIVGRTYKAIVQDMIDYFAWGQYDSSPQGGGWRYSPNEAPDNSACQWVAIGINLLLGNCPSMRNSTRSSVTCPEA